MDIQNDNFNFLSSTAIFFPVKLNALIKNNCVKKTIQPLIKEWQKLKKSITDKNKYINGVGLKLGRDSLIYVVDIDNKEDFNIISKKYPEVNNCYVITRKGHHIYFEWTEKTQSILGSRNYKKEQGYKSDIDFLGEGRMVIAPPSYYSCNETKYKYTYGSKNKLKKMSIELLKYLSNEYQTKTKKETNKNNNIDSVLNRYFQTDHKWIIEKEENAYKIINNSTECLIQGHHNEPLHSCMYANFNGDIILKCFSHGTKKIDIPELNNLLQLGENITEEKENYYYNDYVNFESEILIVNNNLTPNGYLFKKFYKNALCRVHNQGRPLYFCKIKDKNNDTWRPIKDSPFSNKNNIFYVKYNNNDKIKSVSITDFIKNYITKNDITTYDRIDFMPFLKKPKETNENILNTFSGYSYKYTEKDLIIKEELMDKMKIAKDHIENIICNGDKKTIDYLYSWISHLIQKPMKKDGIPAIIMKSGQGTGKNLFSTFLSNIINPSYCITLCDFDKLTGKFNNVLENKLLVVCNEIQNYGGNFKSNDKLKSVITDTEQIIEPKGQDAYKINNYSRFIFLTNNDWIVKIEKDDRRYFCMEINGEKRGDTEYYKNVAEAYQDPEIQKIFFNFFSHYEIKDNIRCPPMNKMKASMKWKNRENIPVRHLIEYVNDDIDFYETKDLFEEFKLWTIQEGEQIKITLRSYSMLLSKIGLEKKRKRINGAKNQVKGFIITKSILEKIINENIDTEYKIGDDIDF